MLRERWWDAAVIVGCVLGAGAMITLRVSEGDPWWPSALAAAGLLAVYLVFARPALTARAPVRGALGTILLIVVQGLACAAHPFAAILQMVVYPLVWRLNDSRAAAYLANVGVALAVLWGTAHHGGYTPGALANGTLTAALSLAFSLAMGLWTNSLAEYGAERQRLVEQLTASQEEVKRLSTQAGAAAEREHFAREVHDTLTQTVTGAVMATERTRQALADGRLETATRSAELAESLSREALAEARALVAQTASLPAGEGLASSVQRLAERFQRETELRITVRQEPGEADREAEVVLIRCLQELLANVRRHAAASHVQVMVARSDDALVLRVADDGAGFDPDAGEAGVGLAGLRQRVGQAGGDLDIDSAPGQGAAVTVRIPVSASGAPHPGAAGGVLPDVAQSVQPETAGTVQPDVAGGGPTHAQAEGRPASAAAQAEMPAPGPAKAVPSARPVPARRQPEASASGSDGASVPGRADASGPRRSEALGLGSGEASVPGPAETSELEWDEEGRR